MEQNEKDELTAMLAHFTSAVIKDLESHAAAIKRLQENQEAEHKKLVEVADVINGHTKLLEDYRRAWTANFEELGKLVNAQSQIIEAMRSMVLPPTVN